MCPAVDPATSRLTSVVRAANVRPRMARTPRSGAGWTHLEDVPFGRALHVARYRLDNGLTVLLLADETAPVVSYHTWFRVGSRHEERGKTGLAHFFEHMMFNETKNLAWGEFDRKMERAGGETNAATWIDWTYYYQSLPADELSLAITLEADRMQNLVVRKPQVESEREVVANERRMSVDNDVQGAADERLGTLLYGRGHPYGWPTIGWMEDIAAYRVADCRAFYRTWYAPNNATVVITGAFDPSKVMRRIARAYGSARPSTLPKRREPRPPRARKKEKRATLRWPTPAEKLAMAWPAAPFVERDHAVMEVIDEILTGGRSARLRRRLVDELEIAAAVNGGVSGFRHGGKFDLWVSLRAGQSAEAARAVIDEELARLASEAVSRRELDKVKARAELFGLSAIETARGKASQIGYAETVTDNPAHLFVRLEELRSVTAADVSRVASALAPHRRASVRVVPAAKAISR